MKPESYKESMEERLAVDKEIDEKELNKVERKLNYHSKSVVKIFRVGESHGQYKRALKNATVHVNGEVSVMKGADKDHKASANIKMQPIVNAMDRPKKTVSDIFSDVAIDVVESRNNGILCSSTEELLASIEANNKKKSNNESDVGEDKKNKSSIVGSMDAVALFTSLTAEKSANIVKEETMKSNIVFKNIDTHEIGIYQ